MRSAGWVVLGASMMAAGCLGGEFVEQESPEIGAYDPCDQPGAQATCNGTGTRICTAGYIWGHCSVSPCRVGAIAACPWLSSGTMTCNSFGQWGPCVSPQFVSNQADWTCGDLSFGGFDGCQYCCGTYDPDCGWGQQPIDVSPCYW